MGTDYPLSVFHVAAWGRVGIRALREMIRTTNRFDRQIPVCQALRVGFKSFGELLPRTAPYAPPIICQDPNTSS